MHRIVVALLAAGMPLLSGVDAAAQVPSNARALGMAGAYVATARGQETLFLNPANLGLPGTPYWSISVPHALVAGTAAGLSLTDAWDILQSGGAEPDRRAEVMDLVPSDGMALGLDARVLLGAVQVGRFAVGAAYGASMDHGVGRDFVDLFVNGFEEHRLDYEVGNTAGSRATYLDIAAAYSRDLGPLSVGVTAHQIRGRTVSRSRLFDPEYDLDGRDLRIEYREVMSRGGRGYSIDVGAAYQPAPGVTASFVVAGLRSRLTWSDHLETRHLQLSRDDFAREAHHWDEMFASFRNTGDPVDLESAPATVLATMDGLFDDAQVPRVLNAGLGYNLPTSGTALELGYRKVLSSGRLGRGWDDQLGVGVQQKIPLLTLRAGAARSKSGGSLVSGGLTLGALELGVARLQEELAADHLRSGWLFSAGLQIGTTGRM